MPVEVAAEEIEEADVVAAEEGTVDKLQHVIDREPVDLVLRLRRMNLDRSLGGGLVGERRSTGVVASGGDVEWGLGKEIARLVEVGKRRPMGLGKGDRRGWVAYYVRMS